LASTAARPPAAPNNPASAAVSSRRGLPDHLPREDIELGVDVAICPCCKGPLHTIGETISKMLDFVPASLRVLRIRRPKYGCRACGTILATLVLFYLVIRYGVVAREEAYLERKFGDVYLGYKSRVRRWL